MNGARASGWGRTGKYLIEMLGDSLTPASARVGCFCCGVRGTHMGMYSPTTTKSVTRSLGSRTPMTVRGPGWTLAEDEAGNWKIEAALCDDPVLTWADLLQNLRDHAEVQGLLPTTIDVRKCDWLAGVVAEVAVQVLAEYERRGVRVAVLVGTDVIQAIRVQRLINHSAPEHGSCCMSDGDAREWVQRSAPPVPPPLWLHRAQAHVQPPRV